MDKPVLSYNKNLTLRRLESLKKKFAMDQLLAKKYSETINKYINKGYTTMIKTTQSSHNVIIILPITHLKTESLTNSNQTN